MFKNKDKKAGDVSVGQIIGQFWRGIKPVKGQFLFSYIFYACAFVIGIIVPLFYKNLFDLLQKSTADPLVVPVLYKIIFMILFLHLFRQVFWQIASDMLAKTQAKTIARLKQKTFDYLNRHSHTFFANNFSGSLVQKVNRFSRAFEAISDSIAYTVIPLIVSVMGSILITLFIAPIISIILSIWVAVFSVSSIAFAKWKLKYDTVVAETDSITTGYLADSITNNNAISFFTGHNYESYRFQDVSNNQAQKTLRSWRVGNFADFIQMLLIIAVEFFIFYFAIKYWSIGLITIGTLVLAQTYIIGLVGELWSLGKMIRNFYQALADSKEMVEILLTEHEVSDAPDAKKLEIENGKIEFENVSFGFKDQDILIENLSIKIKPKEKIALVGHSGSGKTTFVRLIMRLYNLTGGQILIDGQNISAVTQESLREQISFVPQDPVLFHRSLLENIRYGKREATDEEVKEAARLAHCDEFIEKLPQKYETLVGERGIKLSGGERQRVAIARAILKKAPILIFDEATSSLDSYSESLIQDALENLMKNSTTIIIAHRLSTVKKMDRIVVMDKGEIVEDGTHEELVADDSGLYKKLWDLQVGGFL